MRNSYLSHNNIISSLGFDSETVVRKIADKVSGIERIEDEKLFSTPFYGSRIPSEALEIAFEAIANGGKFTPLEKRMLVSLEKVIRAAEIPLTGRAGLIVSTTKGNIDVLEEGSSFPEERVYLGNLGKVISSFFGFKNEAVVLSNACISGLMAVVIAKRMILQGRFDHVFIVSGDILSKFILSGFGSFQALSDEPCKPYSLGRNGITIGEVAASLLVTSSKEALAEEAVTLLGDGSSNDANHISGPSRTGEGLYRAVQGALKEASISKEEIDYISAHGTATTYNDEMEAVAFYRLGLSHVPLHSLKGYFGHTMGASGLVETIAGMHSLKQNKLYASLGFDELGVSKPLNVIRDTTPGDLRIFLKTASGFGGCNTAAIFRKVRN